MTDLPRIHSEVLDIKHRYDLMGRRFRDREEECDHVLGQLNSHQDEFNRLGGMAKQYSGKIQSLPAPLNGDDAEKSLKEIKTVSSEISKHRSQVDNFKSQTHELTRLKPVNTAGIAELQNQNEELAEQWDSLIEECKACQNRMQEAKEFHASASQLQKWLAAKQKMMAVLGPIATEPHLIANQLQQIQVLKDEFDGQKPLLEQLVFSGSSILEQSPAGTPEAQSISEKLDDLRQRYDDLSGKLDERERDLKDAEGLGSDFYRKQSGLREWLNEIASQIDNLARKPPTNPEEVEQQLAAIELMRAKLNEKSRDLDSLAATCEQLSTVSKDPLMKADMLAKLQAVKQPYEETRRRLGM